MILPATPLLVPGLAPGLRPDPLAAARGAVRAALAELTAGGRLPLVLAHGPTLRHGRLRPSLAGSGIGERWLPDPSTGSGRRPSTGSGRRAAAATSWADGAPAGTGASVALLALADVLGARAADVETLEVPPDAALLDAAAADLLRGAAGLVVASGGVPGGLDSTPGALTDGIRAALRAAGADAWNTDVQVFGQSHDHLPPEYWVTILS
ncbi:hypothetical protein ACFT2C_10900 [Promicromonospora sp. NPDC057138]|uniref:hypothetical protein n=1 Tax=Promicromonospora sp. NPDC057138 TaxID=3346031 RepID=UPI00363A01B8